MNEQALNNLKDAEEMLFEIIYKWLAKDESRKQELKHLKEECPLENCEAIMTPIEDLQESFHKKVAELPSIGNTIQEIMDELEKAKPSPNIIQMLEKVSARLTDLKMPDTEEIVEMLRDAKSLLLQETNGGSNG